MYETDRSLSEDKRHLAGCGVAQDSERTDGERGWKNHADIQHETPQTGGKATDPGRGLPEPAITAPTCTERVLHAAPCVRDSNALFPSSSQQSTMSWYCYYRPQIRDGLTEAPPG